MGAWGSSQGQNMAACGESHEAGRPPLLLVEKPPKKVNRPNGIELREKLSARVGGRLTRAFLRPPAFA